MATKKFDLVDGSWTLVSNSACLVELSKVCKLVYTHTATVAPLISEDAFHVLSASAARTFTYGGGHKVYARSKGGPSSVVVTGDNLP